MADLGILMRPELAAAARAGEKTQTRRAIKPQPPDDVGRITVERFCPAVVDREGDEHAGAEIFGAYDEHGEWGAECRYGGPGSRLYVKETHWRWGRWVRDGVTKKTKRPRWMFKALPIVAGGERVRFEAPEMKPADRAAVGWHKRPSIFLPRELARTWLVVEAVRMERVRAITAADILAEGVRIPVNEAGRPLIRLTGKAPPIAFFRRQHPGDVPMTDEELLHAHFASLWSEVNGRASWDASDWVWVLTFRAEAASVAARAA